MNSTGTSHHTEIPLGIYPLLYDLRPGKLVWYSTLSLLGYNNNTQLINKRFLPLFFVKVLREIEGGWEVATLEAEKREARALCQGGSPNWNEFQTGKFPYLQREIEKVGGWGVGS